MIGLSSQFNLFITTTPTKDVIDFHLQNERGAQVAYHQADLRQMGASLKRGLFDLRDYLDQYVAASEQSLAIADIGVAIAQHLLGPQIFEKLQQGHHQRTLCVHLPAVTGEQDSLAATMARVAWEIARPDALSKTLGEHNLLVRVTHTLAHKPSSPVPLRPDEALRVLFVFAESRGSHPLSARLERRELLRLFKKEIYPNRRVIVHFLTHGVTRQRLFDQIQQHAGYHIVHWSGHGRLNQLELASPGGTKDSISGDELVRVFNEAGGFLPRLVFLGACQSGDSLQPRGWRDFFSIAQGNDRPIKPHDNEPSGAAGTAYALLNGGIPSVVAMRFAVNDDYARELAIRFYRALLADSTPKDAAAALNQARKELANRNSNNAPRFASCDHATAVLYGVEQPGLTLVKGPSPDIQAQNRLLHAIGELTSVSHEHFVGRTWELAGLGADFIGSRTGNEVKPVAVITGLGGMGKTALVAEALDLWTDRFDWALLYQAKPTALAFEATLLDIHCKLDGELGVYHEHVRAHLADRIYREATPEFTGPQRVTRLIRNLIRALQQEAILLVFDNFESNLKPAGETVNGQTLWASQDPAWDACLRTLCSELQGSRSRVLITSRLPLRALDGDGAFAVLLGPLPAKEAALYLRAHPVLSQMASSSDETVSSLAMRLLNASRFHPLLMDRLTRLAADPALHEQLLEALETLEHTGNFASLPDLFATTPNNQQERSYLDNALAVSLDQFIQHLSVERRQLLWVVSLANDPVTLVFLKIVTAEFKLAKESTPGEEIAALLRTLVSVGLVNESRRDPVDDNPRLTCHELVRERIQLWMEQSADERGGLDENVIRLAYAHLLKSYFLAMRHKDMASALQAGSQALIYCVQAQAWDQMEDFVSSLVTSTRDPVMVNALIPHLQTAAETVLEDQQRLFFLNCLADVLVSAGQLDASLQAYLQAVSLARAATEDDEGDTQEAWGRLAVVCCNRAIVYSTLGKFDDARECYVESTEAEKRGARPIVNLMINELQMLHLDVRQGYIERAEPQVAERLEIVTQWWNRHEAGQPVPEAPNAELLARAIIGALNIALRIDADKRDWAGALKKVDKVLEIERSISRSPEYITTTRFDRAYILMELPNHLDEARDELEECSKHFHNVPDMRARALTALANLAQKQGDFKSAIAQERRALVLHEQLPNPYIRAGSHSNLANYLSQRGTPADLKELPLHRIASITYCVAAGLGQDLIDAMRGYSLDVRRAIAAGRDTTPPTVSEVINTPGFSALSHWLDSRQINLEDLQAQADSFTEHCHAAILSQLTSSEPAPDA
jgi:tetratricopeptide (TPR) repeat protein